MNVMLKTIATVAAGQGAPQGDENYCDDGIPFVKAGNLAELLAGKNILDETYCNIKIWVNKEGLFEVSLVCGIDGRGLD